MTFNFRKILITGIIILGILVLGLGGWMLFFNRGEEIAVEEEEKEENFSQSLDEQIEDVQQTERITQLSDKPALGIGLNKEGNKVIYYDRETGQVFRIGPLGKTWERISDTEIGGISKVTWAKTRDKVIVERQVQTTPGNTALKKYVYDYQEKRQYPLDDRIKSIVWSPDGKKILYHFWDPKRESNISIADYDGSNWKKITASEMAGLRIYWPRVDTAAFIAPEGSFYGATLYYMKLEPPYDLEEMIDDVFGLEVNWSSQGNKLLYSKKRYKESEARELYLRDFRGETETELNFDTLPDHCIWSRNETSLYCAEKTEKFLTVLPEDYQKKLSLGGDSFWKIDLEAREFQEVYIPQAGERLYNVGEMVVTDDEGYLFFVNKLDGKLYSLRL